MEVDDFNLLVNELTETNENEWLAIRSHIGIIVSRWAKQERIEIDWIASEEGIGDSESVIEEIYSRFRNELLSWNLEIDNFQAYKEVILRYSNEALRNQFLGFYLLISENEQMAWRKVNERLQIYAAKWLSDRDIVSDMAKEIYQVSMLTFVEKIAEKKLRFETSREFKSYYFRILELKTFEYKRKKTQHSKRSAEVDLNPFWKAFENESFEEDDRYNMIKRIMQNSIPEDEMYILKHYYFHEEKLSDIARVLHISDGNCRQKKFQALKKIAEVYQGIEAVQLQIHNKSEQIK